MGNLLDSLFSGIAALLALCYSFTDNYALAIGVFTLIIMLVFTPLTLKSTRSMMAMQRLQPEMKRLQSKHKEDRQTLNEEMMALYKRESVNPLGGCLPMLIQMPVFLILFQVLNGLTRSDGAGGFDPKYLDEDTQLFKDLIAGNGEMLAFGVDLARRANEVVQDSLVSAIPYILMVGITAITSWFQQKQMSARRTDGPMTPQAAQQQAIMKFLPWMLPIFSFFMPAGLVVYFIVSNLYRVAQQAYIQKTLPAPGSLVVETEGTSRPTGGSKSAKDDKAIEAAGKDRGSRPKNNAKAKSRSGTDPDNESASDTGSDAASDGPRPRPRPRANTRARVAQARADTKSGRGSASKANGQAPAPTSRTGGADGLNRSKSKKKRKKR